MSSTLKPLPSVWVDALFRRFTQVWGVQKVSSHFAPPDGHAPDWMEDVINLWAVQLGAFDRDTLKSALQAAVDGGREWPPNLSEFKALCRQFNRPEHREPSAAERIGYERGPVSDIARRAIDALRNGRGADDPLFWAKHPKSQAAVDMMYAACQRDHKSVLVPVLRDLLADVDSAPVRSEDARRALRTLAAHANLDCLGMPA